MSFCEVKTPLKFENQIEKWDRDTMADGEKMGNVIESLYNNTVYNNTAIRKKVTATLLASRWTSETEGVGPYVQTVSIEGITAEDNPVMVKEISEGATPEAVKAYNKAFGCIDDGDTADGQATFKCYNKKPSTDITVGLKGV